jgi:hypothetical protein
VQLPAAPPHTGRSRSGELPHAHKDGSVMEPSGRKTIEAPTPPKSA